MSFVVAQFLTGLANAAALFLVAAGLSVIFGVTRVVNFAHGSFYMLGAYLTYSFVTRLGTGLAEFWIAVLLAGLVVGAIGVMVEVLLLRRLYRSPELMHLVATFGVVLIIQDVTLALWGPQDLVGPRPAALAGGITVLGERVPIYDLVLIVLGPLVLGGLWLLLNRSRFGILVRAATEDREMVSALGIDQKWLFTAVFFLGAFLAGLGGAVQLPREPANLMMDLNIIAEAFVVVVIGGMGSIGGAYLAALIIALLHAFGIVILPEITLVLVFLVMAVVLVARPWGLLGRPEAITSAPAHGVGPEARWQGRWLVPTFAASLAALALLPLATDVYGLQVTTEVLIFALFAVSLQFIIGVGGMISFGHAAYLGLGAYGAALLVHHLDAPMELALVAAPIAAGVGALVFGWLCVRLSGVYLAMLTLAFAQITWSAAFQWYAFTGGDNGILGIWPSPWAADPVIYYYVTLLLSSAAIAALWRARFAPFGYALRAARDSELRAAAVGIDVRHTRWLAFALAGTAAGLGGGLYAFLKGSVFPDVLAIPVSVDGLVMLLLGGVNAVLGPLIGAAAVTGGRIALVAETELWRAVLGAVIVGMVLWFPDGIAGTVRRGFGRGRR
ncbi:MAG: ABC transporter permease [Rhodospirillales bacterium]|nr:MAG: ABC transporter permease [Rhodospirillales bacterium]